MLKVLKVLKVLAVLAAPSSKGSAVLATVADRPFSKTEAAGSSLASSSASMNGKPGQYGVTDVYTRVSSYGEWIRKTLRAGSVP